MSWDQSGSGERWSSYRWYRWEFPIYWTHVGYRPTPEHHGSDDFAPALGDCLFSEVSGSGLPKVAAGFSGDQKPSGEPAGRD